MAPEVFDSIAVKDDIEMGGRLQGAAGIIPELRGVQISEANNIVLGTSTGTEIGTAANQKIGFWGTPPVVQPVCASGSDVTLLIAALSGAGIIAG